MLSALSLVDLVQQSRPVVVAYLGVALPLQGQQVSADLVHPLLLPHPLHLAHRIQAAEYLVATSLLSVLAQQLRSEAARLALRSELRQVPSVHPPLQLWEVPLESAKVLEAFHFNQLSRRNQTAHRISKTHSRA